MGFGPNASRGEELTVEFVVGVLALFPRVADGELLDLAGSGEREALDGVPPRGGLLWRQPGAQMRTQLGDRRWCGWIAQSDEGTDYLAPALVGQADDRRLGHGGMAVQDLFDLGGEEI